LARAGCGAMRFRGVGAVVLVVVLSTVAMSYLVLTSFNGPTFITLGSRHWIVMGTSSSSLNATQQVWASLLGLGALWFSAGQIIAPRNEALGLLLGSYSGDWVFRVLATLILAGIAGGMVAEDPSGASLASALGIVAVLICGMALTLVVLPPLLSMSGPGMSPGERSELVSAVAVCQLLGAVAASIITALTSATVAKMMMRRRFVRIEPLKLPPPPPAHEGRPYRLESEIYRYCPNCGCNLGEFSPDRSTCPSCGTPIKRKRVN